MEHGGDLRVVLGLRRLLLDHGGQDDVLVHGQVALVALHRGVAAVLLDAVLHVLGVVDAVDDGVVLGKQRGDDALRGCGAEHAVGVGREVALQRVLSARQRACVLRCLERVGIAHEAVHVVAQSQEFLGAVDRALAHQIVSDVLAGPAGDDGDRALVGLAAAGQLGDDLVDGHGRRELEAAVAQLVGQALELHQVLEDAAAVNQLLLLQIRADGGHRLAGLDLKLHPGGVLRVHRAQIVVVNLVVAVVHHADDDQEAAEKDQNRAQDLPDPCIPVQAVLPILVQGLDVVALGLNRLPGPGPAAISPFSVCHGSSSVSPGRACPDPRPQRPPES